MYWRRGKGQFAEGESGRCRAYGVIIVIPSWPPLATMRTVQSVRYSRYSTRPASIVHACTLSMQCPSIHPSRPSPSRCSSSPSPPQSNPPPPSFDLASRLASLRLSNHTRPRSHANSQTISCLPTEPAFAAAALTGPPAYTLGAVFKRRPARLEPPRRVLFPVHPQPGSVAFTD